MKFAPPTFDPYSSKTEKCCNDNKQKEASAASSTKEALPMSMTATAINDATSNSCLSSTSIEANAGTTLTSTGANEGTTCTDSDATSWDKMTIKQLKPLLKERGLPVGGRKAETIQRLVEYKNGHQTRRHTSSDAKKKKVPDWRTSPAKAFLLKCLMDDKSKIHALTAEEIYKIHPDFKLYAYKNFETNLANLKAAVNKIKKYNEEDERDFNQQQLMFPRKPHTSRGEPFWDTHLANQSLQEDVKSGKADEMVPRKLWETRPEYREFSKKVFGQHVKQEKRSQREKPYWVPRRNKEGMKRHQEDAEAMKGEIDSRYFQEDLEQMNDLFQGLEF